MNRKEKSFQRRLDIIHAALTCFTNIGYAKTTMADIRKHSLASTGSIYHHFKSKEQLAATVYIEGIRHYQEGLIDILDQEPSAKEGIFAIVRYHLQWGCENRYWAKFLLEMRHAEFMEGTDTDFQELNTRFGGKISSWASEKMKDKQLKYLETEVFFTLLLGPCQAYLRYWLTGMVSGKPDEVSDTLARSVWDSLRYFPD